MKTVCETCHLVIPAKAGIQLVIKLRAADKAMFVGLSHCVGLAIIWIPAFAGMTVAEIKLKLLQGFKFLSGDVIAQQFSALDIKIPAVQCEQTLFDALAYPGKRHQIIQ